MPIPSFRRKQLGKSDSPPRDTRTRIQRAARFFARLDGATLECPHCGIVYRFSPSKACSSFWEPRMSRFTCTRKDGCGKVYVLGLLAWPLMQVAKVATETPQDQVPTPRQALQLRRELAGGYWLEEADRQKEARPETTNLTPDEGRPQPDEEEQDYLDGISPEDPANAEVPCPCGRTWGRRGTLCRHCRQPHGGGGIEP